MVAESIILWWNVFDGTENIAQKGTIGRNTFDDFEKK